MNMESTNRLRYLIAGTGGVGGSIAGFLSLAGKNVTCIARGAHLQAIQQDGLKLKSDLKVNIHYGWTLARQKNITEKLT